MHKIDLKKLDDIKNKLKSLSIFQSMVIHDMRGPVTAMKVTLQQASELLDSFQETIQMHNKILASSD